MMVCSIFKLAGLACRVPDKHGKNRVKLGNVSVAEIINAGKSVT